MAVLFKERMETVSRVAEYKKEKGLPILDSTREKAILDKFLSRDYSEDFKKDLKDFLESEMFISRRSQTRLLSKDQASAECNMESAGFLGPEGSFRYKTLKLYGLIGENLGHSMSPQIHSMLLEALAIQGHYNIFQVKKHKLSEAVYGLSALGAVGANVTIPYKVSIMKYLDFLSPEAQKIGAVNTLSFKDGEIRGYNTDYHGFKRALEVASIDITGKRAVILGTGGASKAVCQCLMDNGASDMVLVSRSPIQGNIKAISYEELKYLKGWDIIINCTPVGMYPNMEDSAADKQVISHYSSAVDLIYNPSETLFLKCARELGLPHANGLYMLVSQAAAAQEIWQGVSIPEGIVEDIYEKLR
jgi:shikimate dehydrogenase